MMEKVKKNKYGLELIEKPDAHEQRRVFEENYYQECNNSYELEYTEPEIQYFEHKAQQKEIALKRIWGMRAEEKKNVLDIGCGEGFFLKYFWKKGYSITGIDYSQYGISKHAKELLPYFMQGDCLEQLEKLHKEGRKYDLVNMDGVLDMLPEPENLLDSVKKVLDRDGLFACKIGNNYSYLQMKLYQEGILKKEYWLDEKGHPWYFSKDGFLSLFKDHGYTCEDLYAEGLTEIFLLNELTNYYENPAVGKSCYKAKIQIENIMHELSPESTNEIMRQLGKMGLGRELAGIFRLRL